MGLPFGGGTDTTDLSKEDRIKLVLGDRKVDVGGDAFNEQTWHELLYDRLTFLMEEAAALSNFPKEAYEQMLDQSWPAIVQQVDRAATASFGVNSKQPVQSEVGGLGAGGPSYQWLRDVGTVMALDMMGMDRGFASINYRPDSRSTKGGGAARALPTFDKAQLGEVGNELWRAYLLESNPNMAALVDAYVSTRRSNPDQPLDFQTYILGKIRGSGRYSSIYRNKPDSMNEGQFLAPYVETAMQYVRPANMESVALGGAMFGADPAAYRARIGRTNEVQTSAPYIQEMEAMMRDVSGVLRG